MRCLVSLVSCFGLSFRQDRKRTEEIGVIAPAPPPHVDGLSLRPVLLHWVSRRALTVCLAPVGRSMLDQMAIWYVASRMRCLVSLVSCFGLCDRQDTNGPTSKQASALQPVVSQLSGPSSACGRALTQTRTTLAIWYVASRMRCLVSLVSCFGLCDRQDTKRTEEITFRILSVT
jgi:hypothetical protein